MSLVEEAFKDAERGREILDRITAEREAEIKAYVARYDEDVELACSDDILAFDSKCVRVETGDCLT